ncbi:MAG: hypothetical protein KatS3mg105_4812 [Gemmatales bacterium]|nr:MAG: hypothetical protein KatS3mg105_4812 [Gemmatales bacterium]
MNNLNRKSVLTPQQDILFCNLASDAKATIERILTEHHVRLPDQISVVQRYSMACPAIPTCGLAISESERALPGIIDQLETELQRLGLQDEKISVRMTGCPNGCVRPYQSDIGIVGRSGDKYMLFVGGNLLGTRLNFELRDLVPLKEIVPTLTPILESFKRDRLANEGFGDFCCRLGLEKLEALMPDAAGKKPKINEANGNTRLAAPEWQPGNDATPALPAPQTQTVPLELPVPQVESGSLIACKETETFFVGPKGEERRDFAYRYNDDDSVRETIVYFYEEDRRAAEATADHALRREAIYAGRVNPLRLHAARKLRDLYYVGPAGHERIDRCILYRADGQPAQTIVYLYDGDRGAADVSSGSPVRRQIAIRNP